MAPTYDLAKKTWSYIYGWVLRDFPMFKINQSTLSIQNLDLRSKLELKTAENPASCIGEGVDLLIIDEASRIKKPVWQEALFPTLSDKQGSCIMISTPFGKNWFYELYLKGLDKDQEDYVSFSFETKDNLALKHLVEEQEKAKKALPEAAYRQEYEAKFLEDAGQVFRKINRCIKGKFEDYDESHDYVMGVDLAKYEDYTVLTVLDLTSFHVVQHERFNKIDWEYQRTRIKTMADKFHCPMVVDATGVGDPIAESLERDGYVVEQFKYTNQTKKHLIENLALKIERNEITFPDIPELINELESFGYEYTPSGNVRYNAPEGLHDDCVNSLALAVHGAGHYLYDDHPIKPRYPQGSFGYIMQEETLKSEQKDLEHFI